MEKARAGLTTIFLNLKPATRLVLWLILAILILLTFSREFWSALPSMVSPARIFGQNNVSPYGVLTLCALFLWLKRKAIWSRMRQPPGLVFIPVGVLLIAGAVLMPVHYDYLVFQMVLGLLGGFVIFFGSAARIPSALLVIYGFAISFPLLVQRFFDIPYGQTATVPLSWVLTAFGYPFTLDGQQVHLASLTQEHISVLVSTACAGPATMAVFIALFALMTMDTPLPGNRAVWLFLFGVVGTWFQAFIRLVLLMVVAYYFGESAMWTTHFWSIYILFPLWYLLLVYIYFRQIRPDISQRRRKLAALAY